MVLRSKFNAHHAQESILMLTNIELHQFMNLKNKWTKHKFTAVTLLETKILKISQISNLHEPIVTPFDTNL